MFCMHARNHMHGIAGIHDIAPAAAMHMQVDKTRQDIIVGIICGIDFDTLDVDYPPFEAQLATEPAGLGQDVAMQ